MRKFASLMVNLGKMSHTGWVKVQVKQGHVIKVKKVAYMNNHEGI